VDTMGLKSIDKLIGKRFFESLDWGWKGLFRVHRFPEIMVPKGELLLKDGDTFFPHGVGSVTRTRSSRDFYQRILAE